VPVRHDQHQMACRRCGAITHWDAAVRRPYKPDPGEMGGPSG
jgi:hypothetical protein